MEYFIDSNIFLRFFAPEKSDLADDCEKILGAIDSKQIKAYTSALILSEIAWVLRRYYNTNKSKVIAVVGSINSMKNLRFSEDFNRTFAIKLFSENKIKFIDALIASNPKVQNKQLTVLSYDKDFDKLDVIRKEPAQVL